MKDDVGNILALIVIALAIALTLFLTALALPFAVVGGAVYLYRHNKYFSPKALEEQAREHTLLLYNSVKKHSVPSRQDFGDYIERHFPHFGHIAMALYDLEPFRTPPEPPLICNNIEGARYRDMLSKYAQIDPDKFRRFDATIVDAFKPFYKEGEGVEIVSPLNGQEVHDLIFDFFEHDDLFDKLQSQLGKNLEANKMVYSKENKYPPYSYLQNTPLQYLKKYQYFEFKNRFEHMHIIAGSGHGKTQTIQYLISRDLEEDCSIVVIDSQNQLIENIANLDIPTERLIWIDPTDVLYPPALNLFDVGMDRINRYAPVERERILNQVIELYEFVLGALLGSEMTAKQAVVFRYITRLMLQIPEATIHTLLEIMQPDATERYAEAINKLPPTAKQFFLDEFNHKQYNETKEQVLRRLYGILENSTFERMMSNPRNKVDFFKAMNEGKIIIVNTARDFLMEQGTQIFGRFIIAMIRQAVQERATQKYNKPCYVYIDEFADYLKGTGEDSVETMLTQARKYKVGLTLSHQYMAQLTPKLEQAIASNTATKLVGGVSPHDAKQLAPQLRTTPEFVLEQKKGYFATYSKGVADTAVSLRIPFGVMEDMDTVDDIDAVRQYMRDNYCTSTVAENATTETPPEEPTPEEPPQDPEPPKETPKQPPSNFDPSKSGTEL